MGCAQSEVRELCQFQQEVDNINVVGGCPGESVAEACDDSVRHVAPELLGAHVEAPGDSASNEAASMPRGAPALPVSVDQLGSAFGVLDMDGDSGVGSVEAGAVPSQEGGVGEGINAHAAAPHQPTGKGADIPAASEVLFPQSTPPNTPNVRPRPAIACGVLDDDEGVSLSVSSTSSDDAFSIVGRLPTSHINSYLTDTTAPSSEDLALVTISSLSSALTPRMFSGRFLTPVRDSRPACVPAKAGRSSSGGRLRYFGRSCCIPFSSALLAGRERPTRRQRSPLVPMKKCQDNKSPIPRPTPSLATRSASSSGAGSLVSRGLEGCSPIRCATFRR
uniref:WGS project CAEQ00000000 data, annotated contig 2263 n=1 Tax=Trypanosoma congolense (strain IL3000) TaxID=1068625 RepID=F9WCT3_TRYCI|nr:unnamed protein product [Trypanosoma congolense IL3000]